jgi:hypothetical protein
MKNMYPWSPFPDVINTKASVNDFKAINFLQWNQAELSNSGIYKTAQWSYKILFLEEHLNGYMVHLNQSTQVEVKMWIKIHLMGEELGLNSLA